MLLERYGYTKVVNQRLLLTCSIVSYAINYSTPKTAVYLPHLLECWRVTLVTFRAWRRSFPRRLWCHWHSCSICGTHSSSTRCLWAWITVWPLASALPEVLSCAELFLREISAPNISVGCRGKPPLRSQWAQPSRGQSGPAWVNLSLNRMFSFKLLIAWILGIPLDKGLVLLAF